MQEPALRAEQRRDSADPERLINVGSGQRELEPGGVARDHPTLAVDSATTCW
jgi:hypothetical protein